MRRTLLLLAALCLAGCAPTSHLLNGGSPSASFAPCPVPPRCATTIAGGGGRGGDVLAPIETGLDPTAAHERLRAVIAADDRFRVLSDDGRYVHTEFTTRRMRYKDDVEFLIRDDGRIDVRSAGRIGWYDWETNRRRIEALRAALAP